MIEKKTDPLTEDIIACKYWTQPLEYHWNVTHNTGLTTRPTTGVKQVKGTEEESEGGVADLEVGPDLTGL